MPRCLPGKGNVCTGLLPGAPSCRSSLGPTAAILQPLRLLKLPSGPQRPGKDRDFPNASRDSSRALPAPVLTLLDPWPGKLLGILPRPIHVSAARVLTVCGPATP